MPFTGDTYNLPAGSLVTNGQLSDASQHNTPLEDIEDALTNVKTNKQNLNANLTAIAEGDAPGTTGLAILTDEANVDVERRLRYNSMKRPRDYAIGLGFAYSDLENGNAAADTACLQALFDDVTANESRLIDINGDWTLNAGLTVGPSSGTMSTRVIYGHANFTADAAIANMLTVRNASWLHFQDSLWFHGTGTTTYADRTCDNVVRVINSGRTRFHEIWAETFRGFAYVQKQIVPANENLNQVDKLFCRYMGSGPAKLPTLDEPWWDLTATFSGRTDPSTADNSAQRTRLSGVSAFPPAGVLAELATGVVGIFVEIDGVLRNVVAYDQGAGTIDLFPRLTPFATTSGTLIWVVGGAWHASGGDGNNLRFQNIDAQRCGVVHGDYGLYGATIDTQTTTTSKVLWGFGRSISSASLGGEHSAFYAEADSPYLAVPISTAAANTFFRSLITTRGALEFDKFANLGAPIANATELPVPASDGWLGFDFIHEGVRHAYEKRPNNAEETFSAISVKIGDPRPIGYKTSAARNVQLVAIPSRMNSVNGRDNRYVLFDGTGVNGAPGGALTFLPATAGPLVFGSITNPGSGGTPGTYELRFAQTYGGGGAKGTFTVDGTGVVTAVNITSPGFYPTAPTLLFGKCPGLTSAAATVTVTPSTVNGTTSAVFTHFNGPALFHIYWQVATNNYVVTMVNNPVRGATALTDAATIATNLALADIFTVTLGGNRTMGAPTNLSSAAGKRVRWIVSTGAGGFTLAWNAVFKWAGSTAPTLTTTASRYDIFEGTVNQAGTAIDMRIVGQDYTP